MTIVVLDSAAEDIKAGRNFYDSRESGIGDYFEESILSDLDSLILYAGIHSTHFGFYRMLSQRFPFGIYYEIGEGIAVVYAILDMRRDPVWIREELGKR
ncbi:MAG: hypothetical protein JWO95_3666 [Verrucomicrobiales bacterium]|nr:hypothetical protein [Verrucomicrobiales bacterium]